MPVAVVVAEMVEFHGVSRIGAFYDYLVACKHADVLDRPAAIVGPRDFIGKLWPCYHDGFQAIQVYIPGIVITVYFKLPQPAAILVLRFPSIRIQRIMILPADFERT